MSEAVIDTCRAVAETDLVSYAPLLPVMFRLKNKPYSVSRYKPFEPMFDRKFPPRRILTAGRQSSKTVSVNSEACVYMANGRRVRGEDLLVGEWVVSFDREANRFTSRRILDAVKSPPKRCLKISTRAGTVMTIAETHPLLRFDGWAAASRLQVGDRICSVRRAGKFGNQKVDRSRIILTAYWLGDGHSNRAMCMTSACPEVIADAEAAAAAVFATYFATRPKECTQASAIRIGLPARTWLIEDGSYGRLSYEKRLPDWVFDLSREDAILFVSRLWATDGMIALARGLYPVISYTSVSRDLAYDLRSLLAKFGLPTTIKRRKAGYKKDGIYIRCRDAYVLHVETRQGWIDFMETFDVPGKPAVPVPTTLSNNNHDTVPDGVNAWIAELAEATSRKRLNPDGTPFDSLHASNLRHKPKYPLSVHKLDRYIAYFDRVAPGHPRLKDLKNLRNGDSQWDEITAIEPAGVQDCWDIEVEGTHNYVLDGAVSHNSQTFASLEVLYCSLLDHFNILHVTPLYEMVRKFSTNYVKELIDSSPLQALMTKRGASHQVLQRSFPSGSSLFFSYALMDATRTRGVPASGNVFDEIQDMLIEVIELVEETMGGSPFGNVSIYGGTPKSLDNTAHVLFEQSSQGEWAIRCREQGCTKWNIARTSHDLDDMIGPVHSGIGETCSALVCAECRKPLRPQDGQWVHACPERINTFTGYHIPQAVIPLHYESQAKWSTLVGKTKGNRTALLNECFGEASDEGTKLVTQAELKAAACLPWKNVLAEAKARMYDYDFRLLAIDWGGGGGKLSGDGAAVRTSFTVYSVLGYRGGRIDVIFAFRSLRTNDHIYEARMTIELYTHFKCAHLAHDSAGVGAIRGTLIQQGGVPGDRILHLQYTGHAQSVMVKRAPPEGTDHTCYSLDKTTALATVCTAVKQLTVRFFQYDYVSPDDPGLLTDFMALMEENVNSRYRSDVLVIVRNAAKSDDFAQSVTYGCCAVWEITGSWPNMAAAARFKLPLDIRQQLTSEAWEGLEEELRSVPEQWDMTHARND